MYEFLSSVKVLLRQTYSDWQIRGCMETMRFRPAASRCQSLLMYNMIESPWP